MLQKIISLIRKDNLFVSNLKCSLLSFTFKRKYFNSPIRIYLGEWVWARGLQRNKFWSQKFLVPQVLWHAAVRKCCAAPRPKASGGSKVTPDILSLYQQLWQLLTENQQADTSKSGYEILSVVPHKILTKATGKCTSMFTALAEQCYAMERALNAGKDLLKGQPLSPLQPVSVGCLEIVWYQCLKFYRKKKKK